MFLKSLFVSPTIGRVYVEKSTPMPLSKPLKASHFSSKSLPKARNSKGISPQKLPPVGTAKQDTLYKQWCISHLGAVPKDRTLRLRFAPCSETAQKVNLHCSDRLRWYGCQNVPAQKRLPDLVCRRRSICLQLGIHWTGQTRNCYCSRQPC